MSGARGGAPPVMTHSGHSLINFAVMHKAAFGSKKW
jgi:hypothetical protein